MFRLFILIHKLFVYDDYFFSEYLLKSTNVAQIEAKDFLNCIDCIVEYPIPYHDRQKSQRRRTHFDYLAAFFVILGSTATI